MDKNKTDIFQTTNNKIEKENFFLENSKNNLGVNFASFESTKRLNDYDFNLLSEDAYKDINDDLFKLEYKIKRTEDEIKTLEIQIQTANDIEDYNLINELSVRKSILEADLRLLLTDYNNKSFSAKLTDQVFKVFGKKFRISLEKFRRYFMNILNLIIPRLPQELSSVFELKKALLKLENLNKSVNDLVSVNSSYLENGNKYEQLSKYIIKANSIQSDFNKLIKK